MRVVHFPAFPSLTGSDFFDHRCVRFFIKPIRFVTELNGVDLQNLLFPAENLNYTDELGYYRQREWRIIENFAINGVWPFRKPKPEECARLAALDDFFKRDLNYPPAGFSRIIDGCRFYSELQGQPVLERVRRILAPSNSVAAASLLVKDAGLEVPVVDAGTLLA